MTVITAVTAQNTCGVTNIRNLDQEIIRDQITAIFTDIHVDAVKIGMLSQVPIIEVVAENLDIKRKLLSRVAQVRKPGAIVIFYHGHRANLKRDVQARQRVADQISLSKANAVLIAPGPLQLDDAALESELLRAFRLIILER